MTINDAVATIVAAGVLLVLGIVAVVAVVLSRRRW
jgi:hypothetical protein